MNLFVALLIMSILYALRYIFLYTPAVEHSLVHISPSIFTSKKETTHYFHYLNQGKGIEFLLSHVSPRDFNLSLLIVSNSPVVASCNFKIRPGFYLCSLKIYFSTIIFWQMILKWSLFFSTSKVPYTSNGFSV